MAVSDTLEYTREQANGLLAVAIGGTISLSAVVICAVYVSIAAYRCHRSRKHFALRSGVGGYMISLLVADCVKSINSIMNIKWATNGAVTLGEFCSAQGAMRMMGNVGTALWSLILAISIFNFLFKRWPSKPAITYATQIAIWSLTFTLVLIGPATLQSTKNGPFFGIAVHGCWITENYPWSRILLEYLWMFLSAAISFILYLLILLRFRGNIYTAKGRTHFRFLDKTSQWKMQLVRDEIDTQVMELIKRLIWYPVLYFALMLPMAIARLAEMMMAGDRSVPFTVSIVTSALYSLSGCFTVLLFYFMRHHMPKQVSLPIYAERDSLIDDKPSGLTPYILPPPPARTAESAQQAGAETIRGIEYDTPTIFLDASSNRKHDFDVEKDHHNNERGLLSPPMISDTAHTIRSSTQSRSFRDSDLSMLSQDSSEHLDPNSVGKAVIARAGTVTFRYLG